ncbi:hypothetical protein MAX37_22585 [Escherichia coli]
MDGAWELSDNLKELRLFVAVPKLRAECSFLCITNCTPVCGR